MKKLLFICSALFFGVLSPSVSSAVCDERELSGWAMKNSDEYLYQSQSRYNGKFAYECGNGHCDGNQVIFMPANHYFDGNLVTTQKLYYCAARGDQMWVEWSISDIADCDILQCRITDEAAKLGDYYIMDDNGGSVGISTGSKAQLLFTDRTNICKCRTIGEAKTACENSGGTWTGSACTCDSAKNLRVENNVCVCLDDVNYVRNGDRCDLTDAAALQQKCTSQASIASGAYWDDVNKQCRCTNQQYSWNGSVCAMNPAIQKCLLITGANWNYTTGQCYCMEVGKTFNPEGTACVDATTSGGASSTTTVTTDQQAAARERIESTVSKLDDIASGLKLTVWRNEEGNFNTSRLLSDSIAGVVLGTAGGLITSNVVKKNQVENGFEDIQCTIGGQVVAGWGDEFRVGIQ